MQSDRELIELAAKASKLPESGWMGGTYCYVKDNTFTFWDPLTDDGDALRLAVKLGICVTPYPIYNEAARHSVVAKQRRRSDTLREANPTEVIELYGDDPLAATRRAITRAAAQLAQSAQGEMG